MLNFELHKKLFRFNKKLNHIYKQTSAMYEIEDSWDGFEWISADEKDNNILSFKRFDKNRNTLVAIMNFSGRDFPLYRLGVEKGDYSMILNTDAKKYGGSGVIKKKNYKTTNKGAHGKPNSITLKLPKFTALYFIKAN